MRQTHDPRPARPAGNPPPAARRLFFPHVLTSHFSLLTSPRPSMAPQKRAKRTQRMAAAGGGLLMLTLGFSMTVLARQPAPTQPAGGDPAALRSRGAPAIDRALRFLAGAQAPDGGWKGPVAGSDPAITALVAKTFIQHPGYGPKHPIVKQALRFVLKFQQPDGGIYNSQVGYANYTTSVALAALAATKDPAFEANIAAARNHLKNGQWAEGKRDPDGTPIDSGHAWYGGAGYGRHKRPDLSNTQMMLEALHQSGLPPGDPVYQKALKFVQRCQMCSQTNDQPFARGADDGGFIYTPANQGESKAGTILVKGKPRLRCYGSMTYAGFKSMLYADVGRDDPRVQRAWDWIRRYYCLESNPNMPGAQSKEGLYYYYHVFAKALEAWGEPVVVDAGGLRHDWRAELCTRLLALQRADGSWVNTADRWQEDNPYLVTAYAVLALQTVIR